MCVKEFFICLVACAALALVSGCASFNAANPNAPLPLHVAGTKLLNSKDEPVLLQARSVNAASMEFTSDGQGHILKTVATAIRDWHANIIRLPLSQDRWFGKAPEQNDGGKSYRELVHQIVTICETNKCYIILDLHWSGLPMEMGEPTSASIPCRI